jgi:type I restriction enzyme S subunit
MPFMYPGPNLCKAFSNLMVPLFARYRANVDESRILAATRDLLLPKLVSGAIRVKDAEAFLKARGL